jgi:crotonobetainyl-CoA:carnitine CoA-transferase CaiB-like acyl-CoA transferase
VLSPTRKPYRTADGYACILPYSDRNWLDFYEFTGRTEFTDDPRFQRLADRVRHIDVLYRMLEEEAAKRTTAQWVAFCDRANIPCMPVMSLEELPDDEHIRAVGLFGEGEHPTEGRYRTVRSPVRMGATPFRIRQHAPRLGQHTAEVLAQAGLTQTQIDAIVAIAQPPSQERSNA